MLLLLFESDSLLGQISSSRHSGFFLQVEVLDGQGNTALHVAVREGWHEGVEELLRRGASPNTKSQPPPACKQYPVETPFHAAVRRGDNVSTSLILQYRPDFCLKDNEHCSVLHLAVQTHNITLLRRLLQEKSCSDTFAAVDVRGNTVLHTALSRKCSEDELHILEIIKDLVSLGLNLNVSNQMGETPLFLALRMRLTRVVKWLLSRGSDPLSINYQEQTVLHVACEAGSALSLKHLLSVYGLNNLLFAADKEGHEPFHMAVFSGSLECCEILLDNGDHLTIRDREGRSRFSYVIEYLPMASRLLTRVFDSRTRLVNEPADNPEFNVTLDYSVLMSKHDQECCIVPELAKSSLHALLLHPLVESFLYFKLWILNYLRFFNWCFVFLYTVIHTAFMVVVFYEPLIFEYYHELLDKFYALHILLFVMTTTPALLKFFINPKKYILRIEVVFEIITLGGILCAFLSQYRASEHQLQIREKTANNVAVDDETGSLSVNRFAGAASTFFGWFLLLSLTGKTYSFGIYYYIFNHILQKAFAIFISLLCLFVGIVGSFYIVLPGPVYPTTTSAPHAEEHAVQSRIRLTLALLFIMILAFLFGILGVLLLSLVGKEFAEFHRLGELKLLVGRASDVEDYQHLLKIIHSCHCSHNFVCALLKRVCSVSEILSVFPNAKPKSYIFKRFIASRSYKKILEFSNCVTTGAKFTTNKAVEQSDSTERWSRNFDSDYSRVNARLLSIHKQFDFISAQLQFLSQSTESKYRLLNQQLSQLRTEVREPQAESEGEEEETFVKRETLQLITAERNFKRSDFPLSRDPYQFAGEALTSFIDETSNSTTVRGRRSFGGTLPAVIKDFQDSQMSFYC